MGVKVTKIAVEKWYVVHPAHSGPGTLVVQLGKEVNPNATDNVRVALDTSRFGKFNCVDYVHSGPFDTRQAATERMRFATAHNFALWGSADDDSPGDNNRR